VRADGSVARLFFCAIAASLLPARAFFLSAAPRAQVSLKNFSSRFHNL
jgi:hypothetical protein